MNDLKLSDLSEDAYTPQQIFDQVWEAPYEWFQLHDKSTLPCWVNEVEYPDGFNAKVKSSYFIEVKHIEEAAFKYFDEIIRKEPKRKLSDFVVDMDANDVDAILQLACFGEIRYS